MKTWYLILAFLGLVIPYLFFVPFLVQNGLNVPLLWSGMASNNISGFFVVDVVLSSVVFWIWMYADMKKKPVKL